MRNLAPVLRQEKHSHPLLAVVACVESNLRFDKTGFSGRYATPDLLLGPEKRLVDIKTVCAKKYYRSGLIRGAAGSGERRRKRKRAESPRQKPLTEIYGSPVDERAQAVHSEYFAKAVACDRE